MADDAYIQSDGTQFIDTGYFANCNTRVEFDCELLTPVITTGDQYLFGTHGSTETEGIFCFSVYVRKNGAGLGWCCQTNIANYTTLTTTQIAGDRQTFVLDAYGKEVAVLAADGSVVHSGSINKHYEDGRSPYSFRLCTSRASDGNNGSRLNLLKIYGLKIYESGTLVRDYVPAIKAGVSGLHDTIGGGFVASAVPAHPLSSGGDVPEIPDDPCIISDGTPKTGITTGVCYGPDSRIEIDYAFESDNTLQTRLFARDAGSPRVTFYIQGTGKVAFGFDNAEHSAFSANTTDYDADTLRHTVVIDQPGGEAYYITDGVTNKTITIPSTPTAEAAIPMALFGGADARGLTMTFTQGTAPNYNSAKARIYGAKFWKGNTLVRDLVPLVKGGVPGFRDRVSGAFLTAENNEQLASFSASPSTPSVPDDGYVALPGNNSTVGAKLYFNTGYVPNNSTRVELDFAQAESYPESDYSSNHNWYLFHADNTFCFYYNKSGMGWSAGNMWKGFTPGVTTARTQDKDVRRTAILDMQNLSAPASIVTAGYTNCVASSAGTTISISKPLRIAANVDGNSTGALKIYGCKIYENGTLVHSFEPYVQNGVAGLLDTVGDTGFIKGAVAATAASITANGDIASDTASRDAYVSSTTTDTFSVNTGYLIGPNTRIDADFSFLARTAEVSPTETLKYQQFVYEAGSQSTIMSRIYLNGTAGTGAIAWSLSNPYNWTSTSVTMAPGVRYSMTIAGNGTTATATLRENGVQKYTGSATINYDNTVTIPLRLFSNAAGTGNWAMMRLYSFRIYEYENGQYALKREFLPYTDGTRTGLYDTVDGGVYWNSVSGSPDFTMSGMGVDGAERWLISPQNRRVTNGAGSAMLSAAAAGAKSYKWTKNGAAISGGADGNLMVEWARGGATDTYAVKPVYDVFGVETEGEAVPVTVENVPLGTTIVIR